MKKISMEGRGIVPAPMMPSKSKVPEQSSPKAAKGITPSPSPKPKK